MAMSCPAARVSARRGAAPKVSSSANQQLIGCVRCGYAHPYGILCPARRLNRAHGRQLPLRSVHQQLISCAWGCGAGRPFNTTSRPTARSRARRGAVTKVSLSAAHQLRVGLQCSVHARPYVSPDGSLESTAEGCHQGQLISSPSAARGVAVQGARSTLRLVRRLDRAHGGQLPLGSLHQQLISCAWGCGAACTLPPTSRPTARSRARSGVCQQGRLISSSSAVRGEAVREARSAPMKATSRPAARVVTRRAAATKVSSSHISHFTAARRVVVRSARSPLRLARQLA
jgi:hypothetical protein